MTNWRIKHNQRQADMQRNMEQVRGAAKSTYKIYDKRPPSSDFQYIYMYLEQLYDTRQTLYIQ